MNKPSVKFPRAAKGKRPQFFESPDVDQMMTFILELTTEVSVLAERLNTVERLLDTHGTISREDIENYIPDAEADAERVQARRALVARVLRMHGEK
jgi:hypothetical protein